MAIVAHPPRSVSDATRFTPTMPHATRRADGPAGSTRAAAPGSSAQPTSSRFQSPAGGNGGPGGPSQPRGPASETPAQKVARLRAAHLAAKNATVTPIDRAVGAARRFFDSAHRMTIVGLIGFTAISGLLTAYTAVDMMSYNRKRKAEFFEAQRQMEADSLEAARLAFMRGQATPEQAAMVEEAIEEEAKAKAAAAANGGRQEAGGFFQMPSLLGAPKTIEGDKANAAASTVASAAAAASSTATGTPSQGVKSWFSSTLSKEEEGESPGTSQRRLGYESLCEEDDVQGVRESDVVRALEDKQSYLANQARAALDREKANQRQGGPLDRIGLDSANSAASSQSWWKFW